MCFLSDMLFEIKGVQQVLSIMVVFQVLFLLYFVKVIEGDSVSFPIAWITDFKLSQLSQLAWCSWEQLPWNSGFWGSLKEKHIQWSGQGLPSSWQHIPYSVFRYRLASFSALRTSSHHFSVKRWFSKGVGIFLATVFKILFNHPRSSNDSDDFWHDEMIPRVRKSSSFTKSIRTLWCGILSRLKPAPTFSRQKLWKLHFRSRSTQGGLAKNHFWLVATQKNRIREQPNYFWNMCPKPFSWAKNKGKLFLDGKSRGPLLARAALKFAIVEKKVINIFYTRGTVPTYGISYDKDAFDKQIKAPSPKVKGNFSFLASNDFWQNIISVSLHAKKRVAWHPKERLPMKLAVIRSKNIEVYTSFNNSIQGNGQSWTNETSVSSLLQTTRCDKTPHLSHDALKKCVRDILGNGCLWSILAVIESENIVIYLLFNKPNQRGGQNLLRE